MRLSLEDGGDSSKAVLYGILSLASVHRAGPNMEAAYFKEKAVQTLKKISNQTDLLDGRQGNSQKHVAAALLLGYTEVSRYLPMSIPNPRFSR